MECQLESLCPAQCCGQGAGCGCMRAWGVCVHLQLWVEKATGEVSMGETGDPRKNLRGIWGRRAGVREVAQLGGLSRCALHCGGWLGPWWTKQRI